MFVFDNLSKSLKVNKKVSSKPVKPVVDLSDFSGGRLSVNRSKVGLSVRLDSTYLDSTFEAFQIARGTDTPPDLRPILDEEKPEKNECLTAEAVTRYRAALGKLGWMTQTFLHLDSVCSAVSFNQLFIHLFGLSKDEPIAPVEIRTDSQAAIRVLQASGLQRRSRHVELRICFCQDLAKKGLVKMIWVDGKFQVADILTKTLGIKLFNHFRVSMGFLEEDETDPAVKKLAPMLHAKQVMMSHKAHPSTGKSRSCPSMLIEASSIAEVTQQFEVVIIEI